MSGPAIPEWTRADRLRKARELAGLTQAELAQATGIARRTVAAYEGGATACKRPFLLVWARHCGVDLHWLTHGTTGTEE